MFFEEVSNVVQCVRRIRGCTGRDQITGGFMAIVKKRTALHLRVVKGQLLVI